MLSISAAYPPAARTGLGVYSGDVGPLAPAPLNQVFRRQLIHGPLGGDARDTECFRQLLLGGHLGPIGDGTVRMAFSAGCRGENAAGGQILLQGL